MNSFIQHYDPSKTPLIASVVSSKGGMCKTTNTANIGGYLARSSLTVLLVDLDVRQPTLSNYYELVYEAPCGIVEMLATNELSAEKIISKTVIPNLDLIKSNDSYGSLITLLSGAIDGPIRLRHLIRQIKGYDVILLDTVGTRSILSDMAVLASDLVISPVIPEMLSTREFLRGTLQIFRDLAPYANYNIKLPSLSVVINRLDHTQDAKHILSSLKAILNNMISNETNPVPIVICNTAIPALVVYRKAATAQQPVYQLDPKEATRTNKLCCELFPQWQDLFMQTNISLCSQKTSRQKKLT